MTPQSWLEYIQVGDYLLSDKNVDWSNPNSNKIYLVKDTQYKIENIHWMKTGLYIDIWAHGFLEYMVPINIFDFKYNTKHLHQQKFNKELDGILNE